MLVDDARTRRYHRAGWWDPRTVSELVAEHAEQRGDQPAYIASDTVITWARYHELGDEIARLLVGCGIATGERVGLLLPDTAAFHAALLGTERAGLIAVGIGIRAGDAEIAHLLRRTGARVIITTSEHRGRDMLDVPRALSAHGVEPAYQVALPVDAPPAIRELASGEWITPGQPRPADLASRALGADELWALNSTSGTTGLPKCVTQNQNRWKYFSRLAIDSGGLNADDVFCGVVPAPLGFGLWSAHFCPTLLGAPTVVLERFDVEEMVRLIAAERVTVLAAVSTQVRMLLNSTAAWQADLSSLRVLYTGGEAIPVNAAAEFERRTGAVVLNFFGSNETGALSHTSATDSLDQRLRTGGRVIPEMDVRLYDDAGNDVTGTGGPGQPGGDGPLLCGGYYADEAATDELYTHDGHMLMGDVVTVDEQGYLRLVGRKSDIIIRGGKNISAAEVEEAVGAHPDVELAAVVAVPDDTYGERACAVVSVVPGAEVSLADVTEHMGAAGLSKELFPEYLLVVAELPRTSGDKVAKREVRELALRQLRAENSQPG